MNGLDHHHVGPIVAYHIFGPEFESSVPNEMRLSPTIIIIYIKAITTEAIKSATSSL